MKPDSSYPLRVCSAVFMLLTFLWLTIGSSLVYVAQGHESVLKAVMADPAEEGEQGGSPFDNLPEEKTETSPNSFATEYLSENLVHLVRPDDRLKHYIIHFAGLFIPFIGESVSQPPENPTC